ncbi:vWA domain-containing protein [Actinokineospora enzanensis]|uniref:vWA domain-containing protein n=1 Tax=Actinokineospora enzanensis TaxID=155975 RepID=UPI0003619AE6|nr:substrate-binding and VWA domain-containing protein [Actinokineospora enzanensis]
MPHTRDLHTSILVIDVEGYGDPRRTDRDRAIVHAGLYEVLTRALRRSDLPWGTHEDRGDGLFMLLPGVPKVELVASLPHELAAALREHNADHGPAARIRLRVVVHAGEVDDDGRGKIGTDLNHAFRLIDATPVRAALADSPGVLVFAASNWFHEHVVKHHPAANPGIYTPHPVRRKETRSTVWISVPDHPCPHPTFTLPRLRIPRPVLPTFTLPRVRWPPVVLVGLLVLSLTTDVLAGAALPVAECVAPIQLNVLTSTEMAPTLRQLAVDFEREAARSSDEGGCGQARVHIQAETYYHSVEALGRGWSGRNDARDHGPEPHVWIPDSTLDVEHVRARLARSPGPGATLDARPGIAESPLVLAAPEDLVPDLRTDGKYFTWANLDRVAGGDAPFTRPDPASSTAGMLATIALYQYRLDVPALTTAVLARDDVPRVTHDVEMKVASPADQGSGDLLCTLRSSPRRAAALVSEKSAVDYNQGAQLNDQCAAGDHPDPLRLLYPRDATPVLDYPFVVVRWADRPTNRQRGQVIDRFADYLRGPAAQATLRNNGFRDVNGRPGHFVGPAAESPVPLPIDPSTDYQAVYNAAIDARWPTRTLLAVDTAPSMGTPFGAGSRLQAATGALLNLLGLFGDHDAVGLDAGATQVPIAADPTPLSAALRGITRPATAIGNVYTMLSSGMDRLRAGGDQPGGHDLLVLLTDGANTDVRLVDLAALREHLAVQGARDTRLLVVTFDQDTCARAKLTDLAEATDGQCVAITDPSGLDRLPDLVAAGLWRQD